MYWWKKEIISSLIARSLVHRPESVVARVTGFIPQVLHTGLVKSDPASRSVGWEALEYGRRKRSFLRVSWKVALPSLPGLPHGNWTGSGGGPEADGQRLQRAEQC